MLFLSIHPQYVKAIIEGRKTVELRKRRPGAAIGSSIAIYATYPQCEVVATATLIRVDVLSPQQLWKQIGHLTSVGRLQFDEYYYRSDVAVGLHLGNVRVLTETLSLKAIRELWHKFQPPQQFRYLDDNQQQLIHSRAAIAIS